MARHRAPAPSGTTWSTTDISSNGAIFSYSNGNKTIATPGAALIANVRGTTSKTSGKWYFEVTLDMDGASSFWGALGLLDVSEGLLDDWNLMHSNTNELSGQGLWCANGSATFVGGVPSQSPPGATLCVGVDVGNTVSVNVNGGVNPPAGSNALPFSFSIAYTAWTNVTPFFSNGIGPFGPGPFGTGPQVTLRCAAADLLYPVPTGYTAWG